MKNFVRVTRKTGDISINNNCNYYQNFQFLGNIKGFQFIFTTL